MKAISPLRICLFTGFLALLAATATLSAREEHTQMHEAADALHAAQSSANPIGDLEKARRSLDFAIKNKRGNRIEAIHFIDQAIDAIKAGQRIAANKLIEQALGDIDKGIGVSQGSHKK
jgi:hypothetical protein